MLSVRNNQATLVSVHMHVHDIRMPSQKTYIQYIEAVDNQLTLECPFISIIKSIFVTHASHPTSQSTHVTPSVFIASVSSRILTLGVDYVAS